MSGLWTAPKTWTGALVTVDDLNTHIRDNLLYLLDRPADLYNANEASDYTTSNTNFASVDTSGGANDFSFSLDTNGGDCIATFSGIVGFSTGSQSILFDILVDGSRIGGDDGIAGARSPSAASADIKLNVAFPYTIPLAAGTHTFVLQWRTNTGTATLYAGAGTSGLDVHPQFAVREA